MVVSPLKFNKEKAILQQEDILLSVQRKGWLSILSGSASKILIHFYGEHNGGQETVPGDYDMISLKAGLSRGAVSSGLQELEAFGIIKVKNIVNKKTKEYVFGSSIPYMTKKWFEFFNNKACRSFLIDILTGKNIDNKKVDDMQCLLLNSESENIKYTLGRLLKFYFGVDGGVLIRVTKGAKAKNKVSFTIQDLMEEGRTQMEEFIYDFDSSFGFGEEEKKDDWKSVLTKEELRNKHLMQTLEEFVMYVNTPTREDVDLIKDALTKCFPYQIRVAIRSVKGHAKYGKDFNRFSYIYRMVINGKYGDRTKNKAKANVVTGSTKVNNQTDRGYKTSNKTRVEMIDALRNAADNDDDDDFDYSSLRR